MTHTLIYDGSCGICAVASEFAAKISPALKVISDSSMGLKTDAVYLLSGDTLFRGHRAVSKVLAMSDRRSLRLVSRIVVIPPFSLVAAIIYHAVASHRSRVSELLHLNSCDLSQKERRPRAEP